MKKDQYTFKCSDEDFDIKRILKEARQDKVKVVRFKDVNGDERTFVCRSLVESWWGTNAPLGFREALCAMSDEEIDDLFRPPLETYRIFECPATGQEIYRGTKLFTVQARGIGEIIDNSLGHYIPEIFIAQKPGGARRELFVHRDALCRVDTSNSNPFMCEFNVRQYGEYHVRTLFPGDKVVVTEPKKTRTVTTFKKGE